MKINQESLQRLQEDVGADVMPILIEQMQQELSQRILAISAAVDNLDLADLQAQAHSVKSTARTMGLDDVADTAAATELAVREANQAGAIERARELLRLCEQGRQLIAELEA